MAKKCLMIIFLFLILAPIHSYAADESYMVKPKFEIEKIIKMSKDFAVEKKEALDKYFIDSIKYEVSDKKWIVHFQGYMLAPGNEFMIYFNEATGKMDLMLGQ